MHHVLLNVSDFIMLSSAWQSKAHQGERWSGLCWIIPRWLDLTTNKLVIIALLDNLFYSLRLSAVIVGKRTIGRHSTVSYLMSEFDDSLWRIQTNQDNMVQLCILQRKARQRLYLVDINQYASPQQVRHQHRHWWSPMPWRTLCPEHAKIVTTRHSSQDYVWSDFGRGGVLLMEVLIQ